jgi:hypothetical protein
MARIAYRFWLRYEYTGETEWLREHAYPVLKGVAEFFRNFPNLRKGADGKYHIYKVNHSEGTRGGTDTMGSVSGMRGVLPAAIRASVLLEIDPELRDAWQELLDSLAPLPSSDHPDALLRGEPGQPVFWVNALKPAALGGGGRALDPVSDCDLCTLETRETDPGFYRIAEDTYALQHPEGVDATTRVSVMSKEAFVAARLGRGEDVRHMVLSQLRVLSPHGDFEALDETGGEGVLENRMTLREGVQALSAQRLGNAASAVQEALCQSVPPGPAGEPVIRLFPAWPAAWDAAFRLLCRGGFVVTAAIAKGEIGPVEILSRIGGECRVRNPWDGDVRARCGDGREVELAGPLLRIETGPGENWTLAPV